MLRTFDLMTGKHISTLLLKQNQKKKVTCASMDPEEEKIAISDEEG